MSKDEFIRQHQKLNSRYFIEICLNGEKLSPGVDYTYNAHWRADQMSTHHKVCLVCAHKKEDKVTVIQRVETPGWGLILPHMVQDIVRDMITIKNPAWSHEWWTDDVLAEQSTDTINQRLGVDGTEYNPSHQLPYPRSLSSSLAGGGILYSNPDDGPMLQADGLGEAILGKMTMAMWEDNPYTVLVYSVEKILNILMTRDGMSHEEAVEFFEFNIEGSYMGPLTPVYVYPYEPKN